MPKARATRRRNTHHDSDGMTRLSLAHSGPHLSGFTSARMGDLQGVKALVAELRKFRWRPISGSCADGGNNSLSADPAPHTLLYCRKLYEIMKGYRLYSCTDQRFVESVFKLVRREFQQPVLLLSSS